MRVQFVSDLHLDHWPLDPFPVAADVLIVAGDLATAPHQAWEFFARIPRGVRCLYVLGNHEHDRRPFPAYGEYRARLRDLPHVTVLENEAVEIGGIAFLGATLWSRVEPRQYASVARNLARVDTRTTPARISALHAATVGWLERAIPRVRPAVVVTHMAPSLRSVPAHHAGSNISSYFSTDLEALLAATRPRVWIHGHLHDPVDYRCRETRIVSNPRGYPHESTAFAPTRYIEL
jgi:Icc-related predicted phosphoesterase